MGKCRTPACIAWTSGYDPRPPRPPGTTQDLHVPQDRTRTPLSEVRTTHGKVPEQRIPWPRSGTYRGPTQILVRGLSSALSLPAQAETRCCHIAYYARHKPTGVTLHDASGLRVPSHPLRIRRAPVHSTDRRRVQSTICGSCNDSSLLIR